MGLLLKKHLLIVSLAFLFGMFVAPFAYAANQDFVGALALTADPDIAQQLKLNDDQKAKLAALIDSREQDALELVLQTKTLPANEREMQIKAYRQESENKGFDILTPRQKSQLERIKLRRQGMAALADPDTADRLKLTDEQKRKTAELLTNQEKALRGADAKKAETIRAETERNLASLLTDSQRSSWESASDENHSGNGNGTAFDAPKKSFARPGAAKSETTKFGSKSNDAEVKKAESGDEKVAGFGSPKSDNDKVGAKKTDAGTASKSSETSESAKPPVKSGPSDKVRFNFRYAAWKDVLDWFAQQAGCSLVMDAPPPGTLNYSDDREYSPAEAIDLLNGILQTKGFTLIRRDRMLMLINLANEIPANLISPISLDELDNRGKYEIVRVVFNLEKMTPDEAKQEVEKLLGPQGSVITLPRSRQIIITEAAGKLRDIRSVIQRIEDPEGTASGPLRAIDLHYVWPSEAMPVIRQMLDMPEDKTSLADGTLRIVTEPGSRRLLVTGKQDKIARLQAILKIIDVPGSDGGDNEMGVAPGIRKNEQPQLETYPITTADPQSALAVLQTLLTGMPDIRLAVDPKTNNLIAYARPSQQATIRATLAQLQQDARMVEVVKLRVLDPKTAAASLSKMLGATTDSKGSGPQVEADLAMRQIVIRGSATQIAQARDMLSKMGEGDLQKSNLGGKVRIVPISPRSSQVALDRIKEIWPTTHANKIRIVTSIQPAKTFKPGNDSNIPQRALNREDDENSSQDTNEGQMNENHNDNHMDEGHGPGPMMHDDATFNGNDATNATPASDARPGQDANDSEDRSARSSWSSAFRFASEEKPAAKEVAAKSAAANDKADAAAEAAPIVVSPGPNGVVIASEDEKALDEFERLLLSLAGGASANSAEYTVFYLKYAQSELAATLLDRMLGGGTLPANNNNNNNGGGMMGNFMGGFMPGGNMLGALLGGGDDSGATVKTSGTIRITPDSRLNALMVQANSRDLATIEELLKVIDQKGSPEESVVASKARMIPVQNTDASSVADVVKQIYADRMLGYNAPGAQGGNPQDFFQQMMRGGRGGNNNQQRGGQSVDTSAKMTISVDDRTNSLVVAAPEELFNEVKALVEKLDVASVESNESVRVIMLHHSSRDSLQRALNAYGGDSVQFGSGPSTSSSSNRNRSGGNGQQNRQGGFGGFGGFGGGGFNPGMMGGFGGGMMGGGMGGQGGFNRGGQGGQQQGATGNRTGGQTGNRGGGQTGNRTGGQQQGNRGGGR